MRRVAAAPTSRTSTAAPPPPSLAARSEAAAGSPSRKKKTGRAYRGSNRTPLRPGGGVIFGPKPYDWSIKINRKEKRFAISTAVASAAASAIVFFASLGKEIDVQLSLPLGFDKVHQYEPNIRV
ncbi:hypothetical protein JHK85_046219 [Glycine max]|nr:hypothetical protein JHK86_045639 [Glycine max]KAG4952352.1 hypothetical protein JHK85_046219 [Glycine max]